MSSPNKEEMIPEEDQSKKMEVEKTIETSPAEAEKKVEEEKVAEPAPAAEQAVVSDNASNPNAMQTEEIQEEKKEEKVVVPAPAPVPVQPQQQLTKVYNYGSTEMDQFWLPDSRSETRRPYLNAALNSMVVVQIACGALHTIILTNQGLVYSQGQNDDGALGRPDESETDEDSDKISKLVQIPLKVDMISAGDSHSVAANSQLGVCFQWGTYRNTEKANLAPPARSPIRVGTKELYRKKFTKVLSGQQHTLVLTEEGELFGWGDPDMGVVGRMPKTRHGYEQALKVAKITQLKVTDIHTGGRHSFLKRLVKKAVPASEGVDEQKAVYAYYSWGLNNFGQLGLDLPEERHLDVVFEPTQIKFFDNLDVKEFAGGESHSIALLEDGTIYTFGRNDIGQLALGKKNSVHPIHGEVKEINPKPLKVDTFPPSDKKINGIWCGSNFSYARDESGQCYSWGFGCNFVLGNRKDVDEDEYTPYVIPRDFLKNEIPFDFALGTQHVSYFVNLAEDGKRHTIDKELLLDADDEFLPHNMRKRTTALAKAAAEKAEKEERAAKRAEESLKRKEAEAAKKQAEAEKKAEKEKERLAKKEEKDQAEAEKKREKSQPKKEEKEEPAKKKTADTKKKVEEKDDKKRSSSASSKKNGKNESNSKSRSKSKTPAPAASKSKSQSKEKPKAAEEKKTSTKSAASTAASKGKQSNGSSNKKKASDEDHAKVSQSKNTKTLKKEPATKKK